MSNIRSGPIHLNLWITYLKIGNVFLDPLRYRPFQRGCGDVMVSVRVGVTVGVGVSVKVGVIVGVCVVVGVSVIVSVEVGVLV